MILSEEVNIDSGKGGYKMQTTKQQALDAISKLPDNANIEDIMYRLYVIDKIKRSQDAVKNGKTITIDELRKEVQTW